MSDSPKPKYQSVLIETLIWAVLGALIFLYGPLSWGVKLPYQFWIKQGATFIMLVLAYYANTFILVPKLLFRNKNSAFILLVISLGFAVMFIVEYSDNLFQIRELMDKAMHNGGRPRPPGSDHFFNPFIFTIVLMVLGVSTSVASARKWQKDNQLRILLEQEKTSSELSYLKSQINPHFFFNTLNNIYALMHIDIESSKVALHKLSRMMRYLLYETQNESTMLSKELAFITDFIELMKLRLTAGTEVKYQAPVIEKDISVSPMLFLPFIENAFKHGIDPREQSLIHVEIKLSGSKAELMVENSLFIKSEQTPSLERGIGLTNTKRRLDLLYPGQHTLSVQRDFNKRLYRVILEIDFSGHGMTPELGI